VTPEELANFAHLRRARDLIDRVTEVCVAVGCTSLGSFSARFTQLVGETPTAYRARDHGALASVPGCVAKDITRPTPRTEQDRRNARSAGSLALRA
jgi:AraC-like DNA-binding protein